MTTILLVMNMLNHDAHSHGNLTFAVSTRKWRASVGVPAEVDFVALFPSNPLFFNKIVAGISKKILPRSVTGI